VVRVCLDQGAAAEVRDHSCREVDGQDFRGELFKGGFRGILGVELFGLLDGFDDERFVFWFLELDVYDGLFSSLSASTSFLVVYILQLTWFDVQSTNGPKA
jgi:hypothetical protein